MSFKTRVNIQTDYPVKYNSYYTMTSYKGLNPSTEIGKFIDTGQPAWWGSVLPNCVGYAVGRRMEIDNSTNSDKYFPLARAPHRYFIKDDSDSARKNLFNKWVKSREIALISVDSGISDTIELKDYWFSISPGDFIHWKKKNEAKGHVVVIEEVVVRRKLTENDLLIGLKTLDPESEEGTWKKAFLSNPPLYIKVLVSDSGYEVNSKWYTNGNPGFRTYYLSYISTENYSTYLQKDYTQANTEFTYVSNCKNGYSWGSSLGNESFLKNYSLRGITHFESTGVLTDLDSSDNLSKGSNIKSIDIVSPNTTTTTTQIPQSLLYKTATNNLNKEKIQKTIIQYSKQIATEEIRGISLLTTGNSISVPYIIFKVGDITFGSYIKKELASNTSRVTYPNYMTDITITKRNGTLNTYEIKMKYALRVGDDPNLLDKVFSYVGIADKTVYISYGDWETPSAYSYKEEPAIITSVKSTVGFKNSIIEYTIKCQSKAFALSSYKTYFPAQNAKGSDIIKNVLLKNNTYGFKDVFPGMFENKNSWNNLIASDDQIINIPAQNEKTPLEYLNYLVSSMKAIDDTGDDLKSYVYRLVIMGDTTNEYKGAYFKVIRLGVTEGTTVNSSYYELVIGYPSEDSQVIDFKLNSDYLWTTLYSYSNDFDHEQYEYKIDGNGILYTEHKNANMSNLVTESEKTWWTSAVNFPTTATLTLKGVLRPTLLMEYLKITVYFYGKKHTSSGLYVITSQKDEIGTGGYKTTLSLTRINTTTNVIGESESVEEKPLYAH